MEREYVDLIMMPSMDGHELAKSLRQANQNLPVLMVTAKGKFQDMQCGFRTGADDYVLKPVNVKEPALRVEALLRRFRISSEKRIAVGSTILNYDALTVIIHGKETILPQKDFSSI